MSNSGADIRRGSLERGRQKRQWGNRKHGFSRLSTLRLQHVKKRGERYYVGYYYLIPFRLSTDPEIYDIG